MRAFACCRSGASSPSRAMTPGRKFCTKTSAVFARRSIACRPSACFASTENERLLRLLLTNAAVKCLAP